MGLDLPGNGPPANALRRVHNHNRRTELNYLRLCSYDLMALYRYMFIIIIIIIIT